MVEWRNELETLDRKSVQEPSAKKGFTDEEKMVSVRRETLQCLIRSMQTKEDNDPGASKRILAAKRIMTLAPRETEKRRWRVRLQARYFRLCARSTLRRGYH